MKARPTSIKASRQRGMTLVELMVAFVLALLVMAAVGAIYVTSSLNLTEQDAESRLQQSGAASMAIVARQIERAGLVDMPANWPGWKDATPALDRFGYLMQDLATPPTAVPVTLHGCDAGYSNNASLGTPTCAGSGSAAITLAWQVQHSRTEAGSLPPPTPGCLGLTGNDESGTVNSINYVDPATGTTSAVTTAWTRCRISKAPDKSLRLTQSSTASTGSVSDSVADNIEDLQFRYLLSTPSDSSQLQQYASAASIAATGLNWSDVTGVEVCLLTRIKVPAKVAKSVATCGNDATTGQPTIVPYDDDFLYRAFRKVVVIRSRVQASPALY